MATGTGGNTALPGCAAGQCGMRPGGSVLSEPLVPPSTCITPRCDRGFTKSRPSTPLRADPLSPCVPSSPLAGVTVRCSVVDSSRAGPFRRGVTPGGCAQGWVTLMAPAAVPGGPRGPQTADCAEQAGGSAAAFAYSAERQLPAAGVLRCAPGRLPRCGEGRQRPTWASAACNCSVPCMWYHQTLGLDAARRPEARHLWGPGRTSPNAYQIAPRCGVHRIRTAA